MSDDPQTPQGDQGDSALQTPQPDIPAPPTNPPAGDGQGDQQSGSEQGDPGSEQSSEAGEQGAETGSEETTAEADDSEKRRSWYKQPHKPLANAGLDQHAAEQERQDELADERAEHARRTGDSSLKSNNRNPRGVEEPV